jgi:hypothetical protein
VVGVRGDQLSGPAPGLLAKGVWRRPQSLLVGNVPVRLVNADPERLGVMLWAAGQSRGAIGSVVAPAAAATITSLATLAPGAYDVVVQCVFLAGVPVTADARNWQLVLGSTVLAPLGAPITGSFPVATRAYRVIVPSGVQTLSVQAIAGGTAGVEYQAELIVTPVEPAFLGLGPEVNPAGAGGMNSGWPISTFSVFFACDQELWVVAAGTVPVEIRMWEQMAQAGTTPPPPPSRSYQGW